jgi:uncharacterized membrane protein
MPTPLHPAIVHIPIALVVVFPFVALWAALALGGPDAPRRGWMPVVLLAALLAGSSWIAVQTGEADEEAVERVVAEAAIHEHEERAELFLALTGVLLAAAAAGLVRGRPGQWARIGTVGIALVVAVFGYRVGHSGGELVYVHGAASAWVSAAASMPDPGEERGDGERGEREADERSGR